MSARLQGGPGDALQEGFAARVWRCPRCTLSNSLAALQCAACGWARLRVRRERTSGQVFPNLLLRAALAGVAGLALGRASSRRGLPHLALTALAVAAVPVGSALLRRVLYDGGRPGSSGSAGARALHGSRDQRRRQLRRAAQQAAEEAAGAGAISEEETRVLRQIMQPSQSRTERMQAMSSALEWLRRVEAAQQPLSRSTQLISALVVYELNTLIDAMDYEELYAAFGGPPPPKGLEDEALAALPATQLSARAAAALAATSCAVCLEAFQPGDTARELPGCGHTFHAACLDPWLRTKPLCPVCRCQVEPLPATVHTPADQGRASGGA